MEGFIQEHVLPNLWGALVGIVGSLWLWIRSKPKERIEQDGGIVDNAKKVLEMSEEIAERLEAQLLASDAVIVALKEKLRLELDETNACKKALKAVREELEEWRTVAQNQRIEIDALKEECRLLRITIEKYENSSNTTDARLN